MQTECIHGWNNMCRFARIVSIEWMDIFEPFAYIECEGKINDFLSWYSFRNLFPFLSQDNRKIFKKIRTSGRAWQNLSNSLHWTRFLLSWISFKNLFSFLVKRNWTEIHDQQESRFFRQEFKNLERQRTRTTTSVIIWRWWVWAMYNYNELICRENDDLNEEWIFRSLFTIFLW